MHGLRLLRQKAFEEFSGEVLSTTGMALQEKDAQRLHVVCIRSANSKSPGAELSAPRLRRLCERLRRRGPPPHPVSEASGRAPWRERSSQNSRARASSRECLRDFRELLFHDAHIAGDLLTQLAPAEVDVHH